MTDLMATIPPLTIPSEVDHETRYKYWRFRIMYAMVGGYASFYLVRKNISMASKAITDEFHFSNTQWGLVLSVSTIVYAFSKFGSGIIADRVSSRYMLSLGLILSAIANILFGSSQAFSYFLVIWAINNAFQGMGMPPCSRLLTIWYRPEERGRTWGVWNASHQIGGAAIMMVAAYLVANYGWRYAFILPAIVATFAAAWIFNRISDSPEAAGLPRGIVDGEHKGPGERKDYKILFRDHVLKNRLLWLICLANFFVYIVRIGVLDWAPKYLQEAKDFQITEAGFAVSVFEFAGIFGAFAAGWLSDKKFEGHHGKVAAIFMTVVTLAIFGLLLIPRREVAGMSILLCVLGFFHAGPMMLIGIGAADYATKEAAAAAVGLTGLFGYIGASVCGLATGYLADHLGWNAAIWGYALASIAAVVLLMLCRSSRVRSIPR